MRSGLKGSKGKSKSESILLVFLLVATSMIIVFPLTAPKAEAVYHDLGSAQAEDGIPPYDVDGMTDGVVHWDPNQDHVIPTNYIVEEGMTLDIPALNFRGDPDTANEITFLTGGLKMEVWGTLITHPYSGPFNQYTAFMGLNGASWEGIQFRAGSEGNITDCYFSDAQIAVRFYSSGGPNPPPNILFPGIYRSVFTNIGQYGVQMANPTGYTNMDGCAFDDRSDPSGTGVYVRNGNLDIKNTTFQSHGDNLPQLDIRNSDVHAENVNFAGYDQPGNLVRIWETSNQTVFSQCKFKSGAAGDHYIRAEGSTPLIDNCSFETKDGQLSVIANEEDDIPAHPILLNPASILLGNDKAPFDNSTMNAIGNSSITLKWYMDVNVMDSNGNPIENAPVWVKDRNGDPASPSSKLTDSSGLARWFVVTEFIQYNDSIENFNTFNVSASNNSMMGFADPEPSMNISKAVTVIVPFNPIPNTPPIVTSVTTPQGVQFGNITIEFMLTDPDPGNDGTLYVNVFWSTDNSSWNPATPLPGSQISNLFIDTLYNFYWDSKADFWTHEMTIYIQVEPFDGTGPGVTLETGPFEVDNGAPLLLTPPVIIFLANDTATIQWDVDEDANATVWYGLDDIATDEQTGSILMPVQTVVLTGLIPGRKYTYYANSTDIYGNTFSTYPIGEVFYTPVYIPLNKGWNLISLPPEIPVVDLADALAPIAGHYDAVQWYDPGDINGDYWKHNKTGKTFGNDLDIVFHPMGIWVHMINATLFIPAQNVPDSGDTYMIPLYEGWNLVGYPSSIKQDVPSAMGSLDYDVVMTFDAVSGRWLRYEKGTGGNLAEMNIGHGYYIHMLSTEPWNVDYA